MNFSYPYYSREGSRHCFARRFVFSYGMIMIVLAVFVGGLAVGSRLRTAPFAVSASTSTAPAIALPSDQFDIELLGEVWKQVKSKYLEQPVSDQKLFYGALGGIVASLRDPYSVFFDPDTTKKFNDELRGTFSGIGAEIGIKKEQLVIVAPLPHSPAERAGLAPGDRILAINKHDTTGMPVDLAVEMIRGQKGSAVTLSIFRDGFAEPKDFILTREDIVIDSVTYTIKENVAVLKIVHFNHDTLPRFNSVLQEILTKNPSGLVLDLRNNPGGFLDSAVDITSDWLPKGSVVVIERNQNGKEDLIYSTRRPRLATIPTVVLINGGTASGAEIMAGALQDYGRAKIVGEKSFGKGSVQSLEPLPGGSSLKITIAEWLTPKKRSINKEGIVPDEEVKRSRADFENDKDPQLDRALAIVKAKP